MLETLLDGVFHHAHGGPIVQHRTVTAVTAIEKGLVPTTGFAPPEGAIDAANVLKPALSRGEIQCIGATTLDEYRKYIEKDSS